MGLPVLPLQGFYGFYVCPYVKIRVPCLAYTQKTDGLIIIIAVIPWPHIEHKQRDQFC